WAIPIPVPHRAAAAQDQISRLNACRFDVCTGVRATLRWKEPDSNQRSRSCERLLWALPIGDGGTKGGEGTDGSQTLRWREPDSNHRFRLRYSPSGSSLVVSADLATLPSRKRSSQRTQRWRKGDSNPRSPRYRRSGVPRP